MRMRLKIQKHLVYSVKENNKKKYFFNFNYNTAII